MAEFRLKLREDRSATIQERRALLNEIARLRAALKEIADAEPSYDYDYDAAVLLSNLARFALEASPSL